MKKRIFLAAVVATFLSCEKERIEKMDSEVSVSSSVIGSYTSNDINLVRKNFAEAFSQAMTDTYFSSFIQNEISKETYYEQEVLFASIVNSNLGNGLTVAQTLSGYSSESATYFSSTVLDIDPTISVFFYGGDNDDDISLWSTTNYLTTFYLNEDIDESQIFDISGWDHLGDSTFTPSDIEYSNYCFIVKENERVEIVDNSTDLLIPSNEDASGLASFSLEIQEVNGSDYTYYYSGDVSNWENSFKVDTTGPVDPGLGELECQPAADRDNRSKYDVINNFKFTSDAALKDAEPWYYGGPEYHVIAVMVKPNGTAFDVEKFISARRKVYKNGGTHTYTNPIDMVIWKSDKYGSDIKYTFIEKDKKRDYDVPLKITTSADFKIYNVKTNVTAEVQVKHNPKNEEMGESIIEYCSDADYWDYITYNTGTLYFDVWEKH